MPLNGEYEPSPSERVRRQVELYEATNGVEGGTQNGKPVIVLTSQGAKSGKIRKIPLMRIEHNGVYAVSLLCGRTQASVLVLQPRCESPCRVAGRRGQARYAGTRSLRRRKGRVVEAGRRRLFGIPQLPGPCRPRNSAVRYGARRGCAIHKQAAAGMIELDLAIRSGVDCIRERRQPTQTPCVDHAVLLLRA